MNLQNLQTDVNKLIERINDLCGPSFTTNNLKNKNYPKPSNSNAHLAKNVKQAQHTPTFRASERNSTNIYACVMGCRVPLGESSSKLKRYIRQSNSKIPYLQDIEHAVLDEGMEMFSSVMCVAEIGSRRGMVAMYRVLLPETGSNGMSETARHLSMLKVINFLGLDN